MRLFEYGSLRQAPSAGAERGEEEKSLGGDR